MNNLIKLIQMDGKQFLSTKPGIIKDYIFLTKGRVRAKSWLEDIERNPQAWNYSLEEVKLFLERINHEE